MQWNLLSAGLTPPFGEEIKDLLHNEPWDCPLPGNEAALVSSPSLLHLLGLDTQVGSMWVLLRLYGIDPPQTQI